MKRERWEGKQAPRNTLTNNYPNQLQFFFFDKNLVLSFNRITFPPQRAVKVSYDSNYSPACCNLEKSRPTRQPSLLSREAERTRGQRIERKEASRESGIWFQKKKCAKEGRGPKGRGEKKCKGWREGLKPMHPPEECFQGPSVSFSFPKLPPPVVVGVAQSINCSCCEINQLSNSLSKRNKRKKQ